MISSIKNVEEFTLDLKLANHLMKSSSISLWKKKKPILIEDEGGLSFRNEYSKSDGKSIQGVGERRTGETPTSTGITGEKRTEEKITPQHFFWLVVG